MGMDYHGDLMRLLRAINEYEATGDLPPDASSIDVVCERVLEFDPFETVARRWKRITISEPEDPTKDEPWRR
ncbi:hypothetical protein [Croceicoccus hydrothermalis]|uniref:hypothetical protein n=1 Tax=Croceicoccus hydrothermalis TaxID=2867964 RepID=UPI001EFA730C|nr:hypothetical protein [Croceicoccus hydrothermalis]